MRLAKRTFRGFERIVVGFTFTGIWVLVFDGSEPRPYQSRIS